MDRSLGTLLRAGWRPLAKRAGRAYVAGPGLADALSVCRRLNRLGITGTIGFWNDNTDLPRSVAQAYMAVCGAVSIERLNCALSTKAPALRFDAELLQEVLQHGRRTGLRIQFDSLGPEDADRTYAAIARALPYAPGLGCTLPARWRRSLRDADRAVELGLHVRVVKGQWEDPNRADGDLRAQYLAVVDRLAGRARSVSVATHDTELAREAVRRLRAAGTRCELELLLGLPARPGLRVASEAGVPARIYVPYGSGWLPYALSYAKKNPRVFWWVLRDLFFNRPLVSV
jgi:proline dehydrogenase